MAEDNKKQGVVWMQDWWGKKGLNKKLKHLYWLIVGLTSFFGIIIFVVILYTIIVQPERGCKIFPRGFFRLFPSCHYF